METKCLTLIKADHLCIIVTKSIRSFIIFRTKITIRSTRTISIPFHNNTVSQELSRGRYQWCIQLTPRLLRKDKKLHLAVIINRNSHISTKIFTIKVFTLTQLITKTIKVIISSGKISNQIKNWLITANKSVQKSSIQLIYPQHSQKDHENKKKIQLKLMTILETVSKTWIRLNNCCNQCLMAKHWMTELVCARSADVIQLFLFPSPLLWIRMSHWS